MDIGTHEFSLTFRGVDCILPPDTADLAQEKEGGAVKRRVVAITEGTWNGTVFRPDEMDKIPTNTERRKGRNDAGAFNVPLVLDHSDAFLDRVGTTLNMQTGPVKKGGTEIKGLILDHEFLQFTSVQKDTAAIVKASPQDVYFSIRCGGDLKYDGVTSEYYWTDLWIDHDSIVTNPACANTGIVGELRRKSDLPFYAESADPTDMEHVEFEKRLAAIEQSVGKITSHFEKQIADQAAREQAAAQDDVLERADTIAAIFALDPEANRPFLKTLSKDQLQAYKADLERRKPAAATPPADGKGQAGGSTGQLSLEERAQKFLEG